MAVLEKSRSAIAKLSALAEVRPDLAPIVRAAAAVCEAVLDDAHSQIEAAKAETAAEIERSADSTEAFQETIAARDDAEVKSANLEIEVAALRAKSALIEFQEQTKRHEIRKAETAEVAKAEATAVQTAIATQLTVVYLSKRTRHVATGKSFTDSPRKSSGPWEIDTPDGRTIICETRQDVVDAAQEIVVRSVEKTVPAEFDPALNSHLTGKPRKFPDLGAETSEDTYDAKAKSERVLITKASGKRKPKWKR